MAFTICRNKAFSANSSKTRQLKEDYSIEGNPQEDGSQEDGSQEGGSQEDGSKEDSCKDAVVEQQKYHFKCTQKWCQGKHPGSKHSD
ncbi:hypothetical protein MMC22_007195 [Lobaria immixta]|nr:hypothetical protein [Lobaria immixta]